MEEKVLLKNKKWSDLKKWQKVVFIISSCLFIFGLIYLPIEYANKITTIEVNDGLSGCMIKFTNSKNAKDVFNISTTFCPFSASIDKLNATGNIDNTYTIDDYVEDYNAYLYSLNNDVVYIELPTTD